MRIKTRKNFRNLKQYKQQVIKDKKKESKKRNLFEEIKQAIKEFNK